MAKIHYRMCKRFSLEAPFKEIEKRFSVNLPKGKFVPRYNIAPGQEVYVITTQNPKNLVVSRWGLIPFWSKNSKFGDKLITARSETVSTQPEFKASFTRNRCLIPASGFYEWDKKHKEPVPYRIELKDKEVFAFAGICDSWDNPYNGIINSFSILTVPANDEIFKIHDRMPVILKKDDEADWLNPRMDLDSIQGLLKPYQGDMNIYEISNLINNTENDSEEVIRPVE